MKKIIVLICGICAFVGNTWAMDLSLNDAVEKIVAESQDLKKADANIEKARASLRAVNANRWFKIDASATYMNLVNVEDWGKPYGFDIPPQISGLLGQLTGGAVSVPERMEVPDNIAMFGVSVTQPIYTFGKIGNAVDAVRSAIEISKTGKDITMREVKYSAANIYWTAKMTDEMVKIARGALDDARSAKNSLTGAARANRSNLIKIESDIATKEINLSDAEFNRDTAHRMLKILAGIDMDTELNLTDAFPANFPQIQAGELKSTPQWSMLDRQIQMYEDQARSKRAANYPTLAAMASYNYVAMNTDIDVFDGYKSQSAYWGLALQLPIFSGGLNRANATADVMSAEAARQDLDKSKKLLTEEYNTAIARYNHLRENLDGLQNARDLAARAYKMSLGRFASGQTSAVELAEMSGALTQLDMALLNAKYNILMSAESVKKLGE